jgi:hypothetical protein
VEDLVEVHMESMDILAEFITKIFLICRGKQDIMADKDIFKQAVVVEEFHTQQDQQVEGTAEKV